MPKRSWNLISTSLLLTLVAGINNPAWSQDDATLPDSGVGGTIAAPVSVSTKEASNVSVDSVGALSDQAGGLGMDLWRGLQYNELAEKLDSLPRHTVSRAARQLQKRLLLTRTRPPQHTSNGKLTLLRLRMLDEMGASEAFTRLYDAIPRSLRTESLYQLALDHYFRRLDIAMGCQVIEAAQTQFTDSTHWAQLMPFCHAIAGNHDHAAISLGLLAEQDHTPDELTLATIDALRARSDTPEGETPPRPKLPQPETLTPQAVAMFYAAGAKIPRAALADEVPGWVRALRGAWPQEAPPSEGRIAAAEQAVRLELAPVAILAAAYQAADTPESARDNMPKNASHYKGPKGRALLWQQVHQQRALQDSLTALEIAWKVYDSAGLSDLARRALEEDIKTIVPSHFSRERMAWFTPYALRVLLPDGNSGSAAAWLNIYVASPASETVRHSAKMMAALLNEPETPTAQKELPFVTSPLDDEAEARRLSRIYTIAEGLGATIPIEVWQALEPHVLHETADSATALEKSLRDAADNNQRGHAAILALQIIGEQPLEALSDHSLKEILFSLRALGMESAARQIAQEALRSLLPLPEPADRS